jgi:hypothetical protein
MPSNDNPAGLDFHPGWALYGLIALAALLAFLATLGMATYQLFAFIWA